MLKEAAWLLDQQDWIANRPALLIFVKNRTVLVVMGKGVPHHQDPSKHSPVDRESGPSRRAGRGSLATLSLCWVRRLRLLQLKNISQAHLNSLAINP